MRHRKGSAVRGRSPRSVYLRSHQVVVSVNVTDASAFVAAKWLSGVSAFEGRVCCQWSSIVSFLT
jgi:hypothetical protein